MTENALSIRTAVCGRYFAVGMDYPAARVFDTANSSLAATIEIPRKHRSSLLAVSLTSLALGEAHHHALRIKQGRGTQQGAVETASTAGVEEERVAATLGAVGLSNGTVVLYNVSKDELVDHVVVSESQQPIVSLCFAGRYLFCLAANRRLAVIETFSGMRVGSGFGGSSGSMEVQSGATSVSVVPALAKTLAMLRRGSATPARVNEGSDSPSTFVAFLAGPTNVLFSVQIHGGELAAAGTATGPGPQRARLLLEKLTSFASQSSTTTMTWLSSDATTAMTCSAQEGIVRIWDLQSASEGVSRCKRTLLCGQRIAHISVLEPGQVISAEPSGTPALVSTTTFTGAVMIWNLGGCLSPKLADPAPLSPSILMTSSESVGRLLFAAFTVSAPREGSAGGDASTELKAADETRPPLAPSMLQSDATSMLLLRGTFAMPRFESRNVAPMLATLTSANTEPVAESTAVVGHSRAASHQVDAKGTAIMRLPLPRTLANELRQLSLERRLTWGRATHSKTGLPAFDGLDDAWNHFYAGNATWAAHQSMSSRAVVTVPERFTPVHVQRAKSVNALPQAKLSLEQRLMGTSSDGVTTITGRVDAAADASSPGQSALQHFALGLATVPLYQALHANDPAAVMDLLSVAARTEEDMRATILSLSYPYCMQLLKLLSEKVRGARTRSYLFLWIDCIIRYRGPEMMVDQQRESAGPDPNSSASSSPSAPSTFIAPLLHQYKAMTAQYDKIAFLYGRMSVFDSVRPTSSSTAVAMEKGKNAGNGKKQRVRNVAHRTSKFVDGSAIASYDAIHNTCSIVGQGGVVFPVMFEEKETKRGRQAVRNRAHEKALKRAQEKHRKNAVSPSRLLRLAQRQLREDGEGDDDDVAMKSLRDGGDDNFDLADLDNMVLDSSDDAGDAAEEDSDASDNSDDAGSDSDDSALLEEEEEPAMKKAKRKATAVEMVPESRKHAVGGGGASDADDTADDDDGDRDIDFDPESDSDVDSSASSSVDEEDSSSDDEEDESSGSGVDGWNGDSDEDGDDDDDDNEQRAFKRIYADV